MLFVSDSQVKAPRIESGSVCKRIVAKPSSIWRFWLWSLGASSSCEHTRLFCLHASESWVVWIWTVFPADCFWVLRNFEPQCPACKLPRLLRTQRVPSQSPEPKSWAMERTEHVFAKAKVQTSTLMCVRESWFETLRCTRWKLVRFVLHTSKEIILTTAQLLTQQR